MGNGASTRVRHDVERPGGLTSKYKLGTLLGEGSFGQVFEVKLLSNPRTTGAVKITKREGDTQDFWSDVAVFYREVAMLQSLEHGNVVKIWDSFQDAGCLYLVTELCAGGQVFEQIASLKRFHETDAAVIVAQMLLAIQYIHGKYIMHRDIKAENFMFSEPSTDSTVKMIDFGMAGTFQEGDVFHEVCGSRFYLAPEMLKQKYDHRIDMWALGVVTYLLCCGRYPFKLGKSKQHTELYQPLQWTQKVALSVETKEFIQRVLQPDPDQRLTAKEALTHPFVGYLEEEGVQSVSLRSEGSLNSNLSESVKQAREVIRATKDGTVLTPHGQRKRPHAMTTELAKRTANFLQKAQIPKAKERARTPRPLAKTVGEASDAFQAGVGSPASSRCQSANAFSSSPASEEPMQGSTFGRITSEADMGGWDRQVSKGAELGSWDKEVSNDTEKGSLGPQVTRRLGSSMDNSMSPMQMCRAGSSSHGQRASNEKGSLIAPALRAPQRNSKLAPIPGVPGTHDGILPAGKPRKLVPLALTPLMPDLPEAS